MLKTHNKKKHNKKGGGGKNRGKNSHVTTTTSNDVMDGEDNDDEEFADVSEEQYQNGVETESKVSNSASNGKLSVGKTENGDIISVSPKNSSSPSFPRSKSTSSAVTASAGHVKNDDVTRTMLQSAGSSTLDSPYHTPPTTPSPLFHVSEASSSLSPKHTFNSGANSDNQRDLPRLSRETAI